MPQKNPGAQQTADTPAAQAAARVAARYAKAPSYSEMIAEEARAAVRAAEAASRAALEAQAAAESVLAGLEAASSATQACEPEFFTPDTPEPAWSPAPRPVRAVAVPAPAAKVAAAVAGPPSNPSPNPSFEIRWEDDMPVREKPAAPQPIPSLYEAPLASPWDDMPEALGPLHSEGYEIVEAAQPIHANLIEFPRELVATRRLRPRRAEGGYPTPTEAQGQLSIFEVEPWAISTEPEATGAAAEAGTAAYTGPDWSGIELDAEPLAEIAVPALSPTRARRESPPAERLALELAPVNNRLMAAAVDFSLVTGSFLAVAMYAASHIKVLPAVRTMELASIVALAAIGTLYLAVFSALAKRTPGMKYASLQIRTFDGQEPTREERIRRMGGLMLSLVPLGLGIIWALFDEQHLCWHDRLSSTYLRKG